MTTMTARQSNGRSADVSNALVQQHEDILLKINTATDADEFAACLTWLQFVAPLWKALDYGYKAKELFNHLSNRCYFCAGEAETTRDTCRRNSSQRHSWQREVDRLKELSDAAAAME